MRSFLALCAGLMLAPPVLAQQQPACQTTDAALPGALADWNGAAAAATATTANDISGAVIQPGKGYEARLQKRDAVRFALEPEKPGGSVSYSGLFAFDAPAAGDYTIALGSAAWIDVIEDDRALQPLSFGHGPECTTIRKIVVFRLKPGRHLLQIAGNGAETVRLMVGN